MKILFISNLSTERCGVKEYGLHMAAAIRRAGHEVVEWDGTYSSVYHHGYLPAALVTAGYDLVHLNWDPQAINHYLPQHFNGTYYEAQPTRGSGCPPLSLFLHDVPPNSTCPVYDIARWRFGFEPYQDVQVVPEAIPPTPTDLPEPPTSPPGHYVVGVTGIRSDPGMEMVRNVCQKAGWEFNAPLWWTGGPWLSAEDEIRRLARSHVNVCWYHASFRGKSMAANYCCAARRPLVLSGSSMFSALWPWESGDDMEMYIIRKTHRPAGEVSHYTEKTLEWWIRVAGECAHIRPATVCDILSWDEVIKPILARWEAGR